jgi:hypothetical protein
MASAKRKAAAMVSARCNRTAAMASTGREASGGRRAKHEAAAMASAGREASDVRRASRGGERAASGVHPASERVREQRASLSRNAWRCERAALKRWCLMPGDANGRLQSEPAAAQGYSRTSSILASEVFQDFRLNSV